MINPLTTLPPAQLAAWQVDRLARPPRAPQRRSAGAAATSPAATRLRPRVRDRIAPPVTVRAAAAPRR